MPRPLTATIDLAALRHNLGVARQHAPRSRTLAVVKADAYGHGLLRAMRAFREADGLALVELEYAVRLRDAGWRRRIVLLEGFFEPRDVPVLCEHRLAVAVHAEDQIRMLDAAPAGAGLDVLLKLNTGMNRLGFVPAEAGAALARLRANPAIGEITLMTHFANADDARGVAWQLAAIDGGIEAAALARSYANSAAILRHPDTHHDWIRPGIMLYGCSPFAGSHGAELGLVPAMTLESRVIGVQQLKPGDTVGYGGAFTADRVMRVGIVACGYADGYPRHAPTGTPVSVAGCVVRTLGRVSMDMLCADISGVPEAGVGSPVVLWGAANPVEHVAQASGTVSYELLCALAPRVPVIEREQS